MNTLTVIREQHSWYNTSTVLKDNKGHVKKIIPNKLKYGTKAIIVNGKPFTLDWSKVELVRGTGKKNKTEN